MKTTDLGISKKDDIVTEFYHEWGIGKQELLGSWNNVNANTGQIARIEVISVGETIKLHCHGKIENGEKDWGLSVCEVFSANVGAQIIEGFISHYIFDFMEIQIVGNMKYGVMVVQTYNTFKDGSDRNNYFNREFFCRQSK